VGTATEEGTRVRIYLYRLVNPPLGTANVVVTLKVTQQGAYIVTLLGSAITDVVNNPFNGGANQSVQVTLDTKAPTLQGWSVDGRAVTATLPRTTDQRAVLTFQFSEPVYAEAGDITVTGPDGNPVVAAVSGLGTDTISLTFDQPLTYAGLYTVTLHAAHTVTDLAGNALNSGRDMTKTFMLDIPLPWLGGEFPIPFATDGDQFKAAVDVDAQNNFVVAWYGPAESGADLVDVYVRQFDAAGNPLSVEQKVTTEPIDLPAVTQGLDVAVADDGRFVVVWEKADVFFSQVQMRVFGANGSPVSEVLTVGSTLGHRYQPDVVINRTTGKFVVAYTYQADGYVVPSDMYNPKVYVERFSAMGASLGNPIQITTTASGKAPHLAMDSQGKVLVVWNHDKLFGRFLTSDGQLGTSFEIVDHNVGDGLTQTTAVAMDAQGNFVVTWDEPSGAFTWLVSARRFNADGTPSGSAFQVSPLDGASEPTIAMDAQGNFIIAWSNMDQAGETSDVYAKRYASDGTPVSEDVCVNTQTAGDQDQPAIALGTLGRILVCWTTEGTSTEGMDIHGQLVDTHAPNVTVDTQSPVDTLQPGLSGTIDEPEATIQVTVAGQTYAATNNGDGIWTVAPGIITLPEQDDIYAVTVTATDAAGNIGTETKTDGLILDRDTPTVVGQPVVYVHTGANNGLEPLVGILTKDPMPVVTFTYSEPVFGDASSLRVMVVPPSTISGYSEGAIEVLIGSIEGWGSSTLTVRFDTSTTPLTQDGNYFVTLIGESIVDRAGKAVGTDSIATFTLDTSIPSISIDTSNKITNAHFPVLTGTVYDPTSTMSAEIWIKVGSMEETRATNNYDGTWTFDQIPYLAQGQYEVVVRAIDPAGNEGTDSMTLTVLAVQDDFDIWEAELFFLKWTEVYEGDRDVPPAASAGESRSWGPEVTGTKLVQDSNIYSSNSSTDLLARKGTYLLYNEGAQWTDYKVSFQMQSVDDGDIGLMFRVQDENNYYRFSWNRTTGERRLVKCVNGKFTLLVSDKAPMVLNQTYNIQVLATRGVLEVYVDDTETPVLVYNDTNTSLRKGTMAFYCHSTKGGYFDTLKVEDLSKVNLPPRITKLHVSATRIFDNETVAFDSIAYDPDEGKTVTYKWVLAEGQGTFNDATLKNPVFTPATISTPMICMIHLEVSDGTVTVKSKTIEIEVYHSDTPVFLNEDFADGETDDWDFFYEGKTLPVWSAATGVLKQTAAATTTAIYQKGTIWTQYQIDVDMLSNADAAIGVVFRAQDENNYYRFVWNNQDGTRRLQKCVNGVVTDLVSDKAKFVKGQTYKVSLIALGQYLAVDIGGQRIFATTDGTFLTGTIGLYCSKNKAASFDNVAVTNLKNVDMAPIVTSVTAAPTTVTDDGNDKVHLQVAAYDPDGDTLTYRWLIQSGQGTFSDATKADTDFAPANVAQTEAMTLAVEISDGSHTITKTVVVKVFDSDAPILLSDDFNDGNFNGWVVKNLGKTKSSWKVSVVGDLNQKSSTSTTLVYEQGTYWKDYQTDVDLRSNDKVAIGVMFRVQDAKNYYRFIWNNKDGTRRLQRIQNGVVTDLASDKVKFTKGQTYKVSLIAFGQYLAVDIGGQRIFNVMDGTFGSGTIALYSSGSNPGSLFDNVVVTNLKGADLAPVVTSVTATPTKVTDDGSKKVHLNVAAYDPDEDILTYQWTVQSGQGTFSDATNADTDFTPGDVTQTETMTLKVEISDGSSTVTRTVEVKVYDADATILLSDDFNDGNVNGWVVKNQSKTKSAWSVSAGVLNQKSTAPTALVYEEGTYWSNYQTDVDLRSNADAAIGVMFRVQDDKNYYRFIWNNKDGTRRLQRVQNGVVTDLASDKVKFTKGQTYKVSLFTFDQYLVVNIDGQRIFAVTDGTFGSGTIALYSSGNKAATFDNVVVTNLKGADPAPVITTVQATPTMIRDTESTQLQASAYDLDGDILTYQWSIPSGQGTFSDPNAANPVFTPGDVVGKQTMTLMVEISDGISVVGQTVEINVLDANGRILLNEDFPGNFDGWTIVDQGNRNAPSNWSAASGSMVESSGIYYASDGILNRGTFAKFTYGYGDPKMWSDYEVTLSMRSPSDGDMGLMFRVQDDNDCYRFSMNAKEGYHRLVKCVGGIATQLASKAGGYTLGQTYQVRVLVLGSLIKVYVDNAEVFSVNDATLAKGSIALYSCANAGSSFDDVVLRNLKENKAPTITSITATPASINENTTSQLDVLALDPDGEPLTYRWFVQSGQGTLSNTTIANPVYTPPDVTDTQTFTLMVEVSDGSLTVSQTVDIQVMDTLIYDTFPDNYDGWQVVDQGNINGPSQWSAASGGMVQSSGITTMADPLGKRGTFAKFTDGSSWTNYEVMLTMKSTSDGDIGLMFRVVDDNDCYRFSMNAKEGYRRLVKVDGGIFTQLASASGGYTVGQNYQVKVRVIDSSIKVYVDNDEIFSITDTSLARGTIALYSCGNPGSTFDDVLVSPIE